MTHAEIIRLHHWITKFQALKPRCVCITYERNADFSVAEASQVFDMGSIKNV